MVLVAAAELMSVGAPTVRVLLMVVKPGPSQRSFPFRFQDPGTGIGYFEQKLIETEPGQMLAVAWVQDFANDTETAPKSFTTVLGAFPNDSVRRPAIHQEPYRALDNGFSEWHSTDIGYRCLIFPIFGARRSNTGLFAVCWLKLIKIGAKVVRNNRYTTFQMAAVAIGQPLFAEIA